MARSRVPEIWSDNEEANINCLGCSSSNKRECKYFLIVCICLKKLMARFCQSVFKYFAWFQCFMCMKSFKELISPRTGTFLRSDSVTLSVWSLVLFLFVTFSLSEYFKKSHDIRNAIKFVVLLLGRRGKF